MPLTWRVLDRRPVHSLGEYVARGGGAAARAARDASPDEIIELVRASGLRGRGGAGFPTGTKWRTVADARSDRHVTTVVVNAAEGEPGTFKDRALLRTNPYRILEGAIIAAAAMQSDQIRIGIKATFHREIDRLEAAIAEVRERGWLRDLDVQLVLGPSSYLFGEETALLEVIEGRQPFPRVAPPYRRGLQEHDTRSAGGVSLATVGGSEGPPALVDNVETLANVPLIVDAGPAWFRELGTEASPGTVICTVTGATRRSGVGEVALGTTLREVIDLVGWGPRPGHGTQVVLSGTANALIPSTLLDTPLTYEAMREAGSGLGSAGFIVFDDTTEPLAIAAGVARFLSVESCGQCEHCKSDGLDIADTLHRLLEGPTGSAGASLRRLVETVPIGARCNLAQQQATTTASLLELFPDCLTRRSRASDLGSHEVATIAPIHDLVGGRAILDARQLDKQPDWTFDTTSSGATPAARLGNTPVHITRDRPERWSDWAPDLATDASLPLAEDVHEVHDAIEASIERAMEEAGDDLDDRIADVVVAVRTHVDVTRRVLFPMARRLGSDDGDRLADAAEAQEEALLRSLREIDRSELRRSMQDVGVAFHEHAAIGDRLLAVLQGELDTLERERIADGLAAARATSTVSRLHRSAAREPEPIGPPVPWTRAPGTDAVARDDLRTRPEPSDPGEPTPDASADADQVARVAAPTAVVASVSETTRNATEIRRPVDHTMVVGVDGSPAAAVALGWAGRLAARVGAELHVANVFEPEQAELSPAAVEELLADAERRLVDEWTAPLEGTGIPYRCMQLTGSPDRLLEATDAAGADLLVIGTRGAGRHAGLHIGSLAHHLAHYTDTALAIVPFEDAASNLDRIVIGVDGSPGSAAAVRWCADVLGASGAEVTVVCAFDPPARHGSSDGAERWRRKAEEAISDEWIAPLRAVGGAVRTRIVEDKHPLAALEAAAAAEDAGLFVVGTRGLSEVGGLRLGRLPLHLVHHTHRPVILVPPAARPEVVISHIS